MKTRTGPRVSAGRALRQCRILKRRCMLSDGAARLGSRKCGNMPFHGKIRASRRDPATGASGINEDFPLWMRRVHSTSLLDSPVTVSNCICPDGRRCDRKVRGNTPIIARTRILWVMLG